MGTNMKAFIALSCLLAVAVAEPWGFGAWGGNSGLRTVYPSTTYSGINTWASTRYSGLKTYPSTMYNSLNTYPTVYNGLNTYNGHFNTGLTHMVKREADAEPTHYRGWGRRSFSGRTVYPNTMYSGLNTYPSTMYSTTTRWGGQGYSGRTYPSTMYSGLKTYPSTMYSGLNTYNGRFGYDW